jgi:hypothetical protein
MKALNFGTLAVLSLALISCGSDKPKANEEGAVYFSQFVTSSGGIAVQEDLVATQTQMSGYYQYNNNYNAQTVRLKLDSDGTFFLYSNPVNQYFVNETDRQNFRYEGKVGEWKIEGSKLVLGDVGSTLDYSSTTVSNGVSVYNNNNPYGQYGQSYEYSKNCFTVVNLPAAVSLDTNSPLDKGARVEALAFSAGSSVKFCRQ